MIQNARLMVGAFRLVNVSVIVVILELTVISVNHVPVVLMVAVIMDIPILVNVIQVIGSVVCAMFQATRAIPLPVKICVTIMVNAVSTTSNGVVLIWHSHQMISPK